MAIKYKAIISYKVNTPEKLTIYSEFIERITDQMRIKPIITEKTNEYIIEFVFLITSFILFLFIICQFLG